MNENFTFYDNAGMIRQQAISRRIDADLTAELNQWFLYEEHINGDDFYFVNNVKTQRPDLIRFENGYLKGVPKDALFYVDQQEYISDGTDIEILFKHAGSYKISSNPFPVKRFEVIVDYEIDDR